MVKSPLIEVCNATESVYGIGQQSALSQYIVCAVNVSMLVFLVHSKVISANIQCSFGSL